MKIISVLCIGLFLSLGHYNSQTTDDVIIFYSEGATFAPIIKTSPGAEVLWMWDDNTTSTSTSPVKIYGTPKPRINKLKVTPWSALRRINLGYDAQDGGSDTIEMVDNQNVSKVRNLGLAAASLKDWCSSYNPLDSLDFSDFINLEVIECYYARSLKSIQLTNTPKLRRLCLEACNLDKLNISGCTAVEDIRGAINDYPDIIFPENIQQIWHICVRDNPQIVNQHLFNDMTPYKKLHELFIWNTNQSGTFSFKTNTNQPVDFQAANNFYTSLDLTGALQNPEFKGNVDFSHNLLSNVDIANCTQINSLNLSYNLLSQSEIDKILMQLDNLQTYNRSADLSYNNTPSPIGLHHITSLTNKSWSISYDKPSDITHNVYINNPFQLSPNPAKNTIYLNSQYDNIKINKISLYNANGMAQNIEMSEIPSSHKISIKLENLPSGIFFLKIFTNHNIYSCRFIHQ